MAPLVWLLTWVFSAAVEGFSLSAPAFFQNVTVSSKSFLKAENFS